MEYVGLFDQHGNRLESTEKYSERPVTIIGTPSGPMVVDKQIYEDWSKEEAEKWKLLEQRVREEERHSRWKRVLLWIGGFVLAVIATFGYSVWKSGKNH